MKVDTSPTDSHTEPGAGRPPRKSASMRLAEMQYGQPLDTLLPDLLGRLQTVEAIADELGIGYSTAWRWLVQWGFSTRSMDQKELHRQDRERARGHHRAPTPGAARRSQR